MVIEIYIARVYQGTYDAEKTDVFALGVLLYYLLFYTFPWIKGQDKPCNHDNFDASLVFLMNQSTSLVQDWIASGRAPPSTNPLTALFMLGFSVPEGVDEDSRSLMEGMLRVRSN